MERRALVVDDEKDISMIISKVLEKKGWEAEPVHSINQAQKKLYIRETDLIFLDIQLPDGLGFDLIPYIRQTNFNTKVVIISAYEDYENKLTEYSDIIYTFLKKPLSIKKINHVVANI